MDYTTAPRSLIYRERRSMEEFGAYEAESITRPLAEAMLRMDFIQHSDSENRALWCMNTAFYICTMVLLEVDPRWRLSKYKSIAIPKWNYRPEDFQVLTLSLAGLLLSRLEETLHLLSMKGQTRNHFVSIMLDEGDFNPIFKQLYERLNEDPHIIGTVPNSTFNPRVIDKECIHDVMSDTAFNWVNFTKYWEERSVRDIVKCFGISEDEKHNVIDILRQSSHGFYSAGCNDCPEQVDAMLDSIDQEIHLQYNPEDDRTVEDENDDEGFLELKPYEEALIDMLKGENARLHEEVEQLKEYIKNAITIDLDNEVIDLGEFGSIVDNASKMHGKAIDKVEKNESADSQQENENDEILRRKLADAQKTIEEQKQTIKGLQAENEQFKELSKQPVISTENEDVEELKSDLEHYKSISETYQNIIKRYEDELGPLEELDDWKEQLSIKERIILFQALTGCSLKGVDKKVKHASQLAKAKFIARFSGNNPSKIRSGINLLYSEIEEVESKKSKDFSKGTKAAALNVYNFLHLAVEGTTIGSKPHRCQIAMQAIDQTYHLNIDRAVAPPKDDNFLIEQEPQDE